jgi:hypothetical protein
MVTGGRTEYEDVVTRDESEFIYQQKNYVE